MQETISIPYLKDSWWGPGPSQFRFFFGSDYDYLELMRATTRFWGGYCSYQHFEACMFNERRFRTVFSLLFSKVIYLFWIHILLDGFHDDSDSPSARSLDAGSLWRHGWLQSIRRKLWRTLGGLERTWQGQRQGVVQQIVSVPTFRLQFPASGRKHDPNLCCTWNLCCRLWGHGWELGCSQGGCGWGRVGMLAFVGLAHMQNWGIRGALRSPSFALVVSVLKRRNCLFWQITNCLRKSIFRLWNQPGRVICTWCSDALAGSASWMMDEAAIRDTFNVFVAAWCPFHHLSPLPEKIWQKMESQLLKPGHYISSFASSSRHRHPHSHGGQLGHSFSAHYVHMISVASETIVWKI